MILWPNKHGGCVGVWLYKSGVVIVWFYGQINMELWVGVGVYKSGVVIYWPNKHGGCVSI